MVQRLVIQMFSTGPALVNADMADWTYPVQCGPLKMYCSPHGLPIATNLTDPIGESKSDNQS